MKTPVGDQGLYILNTAVWRTFRPVINKDLCTNCGICLIYCPVNSVRKINGSIEMDLSYCKGCGICREECPKKAIEWVEEVR
ncbi:4Fe-4S binding protein [Paradesulfitobacterium aromaticivorans]